MQQCSEGFFELKKAFAYVHVIVYLERKIQPVMLVPAVLGKPGAV